MLKTIWEKIKGGETKRGDEENMTFGSDKQRKAFFAKNVDKSIFKTYKFQEPPKDFKFSFPDLLSQNKQRGKNK